MTSPAKNKPRSSGSVLQLVADADPRSPAAEAYRTLRTNIQFASLDKPHRTLVVTSASPGEGKTTTVANFGVVVAQAGSRVCLVDADLRRPSLHRIFDVPNTQGLTSAIVDDVPLGKIALPTHVSNVFLVTSGPLPPNPAELVGSHRMHDLLEAATKDFDLILCDTPPIVAVTDAVSLAARCDGVILVVRVGAVPHDVIRRAAAQMEAVKAPILGVLLNSVNMRRDGHYYEYYRYYHRYYGNESSNSPAAS